MKQENNENKEINSKARKQIFDEIQIEQDKIKKINIDKARRIARRLIDKIYAKKFTVTHNERIGSNYLNVNLWIWQSDINLISEVKTIMYAEGFMFMGFELKFPVPQHTWIFEILVDRFNSPFPMHPPLSNENDGKDWVEIRQATYKHDNEGNFFWMYHWYKDGRVTKTKMGKNGPPFYVSDEIEIESIEWNPNDFDEITIGLRGPKAILNLTAKSNG